MMVYIYRCFDADGCLLYVGMSADPLGRRKQDHVKRTPWFPRVRQIEVSEPMERAVGRKREVEIIKAEHPLFNKRLTMAPLELAPNGSAHSKMIERFAKRRKVIHSLRNDGWTLDRIAARYDISKQRVSQILAATAA